MADELVEKEGIRALLIQYFTSLPERLTENQVSNLRHSLEPEQEAHLRTFVSILFTRDRGMSITNPTEDTQSLVVLGYFKLREPDEVVNMVAGILGVGSDSLEFVEIRRAVVNHMGAHLVRSTHRPVPPPPPPGALPKVVVDMEVVLDRHE
jgi:hypothetical protein